MVTEDLVTEDYKYMPGRWSLAAKKIIKTIILNEINKILDVGCGKDCFIKRD